MSGIRVPDLVSHSRLSRNVSDLKAQIDKTSNEATTGRYEDLTAQLKGDVGGAHLLKKAIDDARLYKDNLALAQSRAQITQSALGNIGDESSRIATELHSAVGREDGEMIGVLVDDARAAITNTVAALNATISGRALFAGDAADTPPILGAEDLITDVEAIIAGATDAADAAAQLDTYFNDPAGGFATTIYQGGDGRAAPVEIAPGVRLDVSAKANDPAIRDMLRGLATIAAYESAGFSDAEDLLLNGADTIYGAEAQLIDQRAAIGVNEARIASAKERFENEETVLSELYNDKTLRDPYEAASELRLLESQLEAAYLLTARLAQLSLSNFIR